MKLGLLRNIFRCKEVIDLFLYYGGVPNDRENQFPDQAGSKQLPEAASSQLSARPLSSHEFSTYLAGKSYTIPQFLARCDASNLLLRP
jgi:hypothetical protein